MTTKENSAEFSGCAKESQACLFFGRVGQGYRGQKKKNLIGQEKGVDKTQEHRVRNVLTILSLTQSKLRSTTMRRYMKYKQR